MIMLFTFPAAFTTAAASHSHDYTFATIYAGNSSSNYFKAVILLGISLVETKTISNLSSLLVGVHALTAAEQQCLEGLGVNLVTLNYEWIDRTRPEPRRWHTFLKPYLFNLTSFRKLIYVDSDGVALSDLRILARYPSISAVRRKHKRRNGIDYYNTGVMVFSPSKRLFSKMLSCWQAGNYSSIWFGDTQLTEQEMMLHCLRGDFLKLPLRYNCKTLASQSKKCAFLHSKWWNSPKSNDQYKRNRQNVFEDMYRKEMTSLCVRNELGCEACHRVLDNIL